MQPPPLIKQLNWAVGAQSFNTLLGIGTAVVLVFWVEPSLFGWFAMVGTAAIVLTMLRNWGFGPALLHFRVREEGEYRYLHTLMVLAGILSSILLLLGIPLVQRFFATPIPHTIFWAFAITAFGESFLQVPYAVLSQRGDFPALGRWEMIIRIISSSATLALVLSGFPLAGLLFRATFPATALAFFVAVRFPWVFRFSLSKTADYNYFNFCWPFFLDGNLSYAVRNVDDLLVGKFFGDAALGVYSRAYRLLTLPLSTVSLTVGRVYLPQLAEADTPRKSEQYLDAVRLIATLLYPVLLYVALTASEWTLHLLNSDWSTLGPLLTLFALLGLVQSIDALEVIVFQALGRTKLQLLYGGTGKLFTVLLLLAYAPFAKGPIDLAAVYALCSGIYGLVVTHKVLDLLGIAPAQLLRTIRPALFWSLIAGGLTWGLLEWSDRDFGFLLLSPLIFFGLYFCLQRKRIFEQYKRLSKRPYSIPTDSGNQ